MFSLRAAMISLGLLKFDLKVFKVSVIFVGIITADSGWDSNQQPFKCLLSLSDLAHRQKGSKLFTVIPSHL